MSRGAYISISVVVAMLSGALAQALPADTHSSPPSGWFGNVYLGGERSFDARKVFVVSYRVGEGSVQLVDASVAYGAAPRFAPARSDYLVELVGAQGQTLAAQQVVDPRRAIVEKEGNVTLSSALLTVRFTFNREGEKIRLKDSEGMVVAESYLAPTIDAFCKRNENDPDCRT